MSEMKFPDALDSLNKPQDSKALLKILIAIRKEVEFPKHKDKIFIIRQKGSIKHLVKILHLNKNVVDISLSILGNCLMDKGCARDAIGVYNIISTLAQVLKRHPEEDSVSGRLFRIIGNMCHHKDQWANIVIDQQPSIVTYGVELLRKFTKSDSADQKNNSEATVAMTIRALRLLQNRRTIITLVRNFEVLKVVGALFIMLSQKWQENGSNQMLLQNIIRLFYDYSKYKYYHSILQLRNTERGDSLLQLSSVLLLAPKRIVKIVMNFIRISQLKSELPIPEICDKFIDVLLTNLNEKDFQKDSEDYIECLCFMLENPANRSSDRCGKCIQILIQIINDFEDPTDKELQLCTLILKTLNQCIYDENLIQQQLKCNIIEVLHKKLQWIVGESLEIGKSHKRRKKSGTESLMKYLEWDLEPAFSKRKKCVYDEVVDLNTSLLSPQSVCSSDDDRFDRAVSPSLSIDSDNPSSPCSSPPPLWMSNVDSDSDDYSPVCSEADPSEFDSNEINEKQLDDVEGTNCEVEELETDDITMYPNEKDELAEVKKARVLTEIMVLLKCFTRVRPAVPQLGNEKLLWSLLKSLEFYVNVAAYTNPIDIIVKVLESHEYLIPLMSGNFVEKVYDLTIPQHKRCGTCFDFELYAKVVLKKLTKLAESESGKGDIAHKLLRGSDELKQQLVLVIPYIIWNKFILRKLMLDCGGLDTLMKLLQQENTMKHRTCKVLCAMATKNLKIANPKDVTLNLGKRQLINFEAYNVDEACVDVVTFKLDDGSSLEVDREFLCDKSDFFSRLLKGSFKESNENEITLRNVRLRPFECLLQVLRLVDNNAEVDVKIDLETLLDVIVLSDRYLMPDLCASLVNSVEKFRISRKTVPAIYRWSLESRTNLLRVETIAYALVADLSISKRLKMFEELFELGCCSELLEDIHKLLVRYLRHSASSRT